MKKITNNPDFVYEISCDQLCGKGHYSMMGTIIVQTQAEYDKWINSQQTYYASVNPSAAPAQPSGDNAAPKKDTTKAVTLNN